MANGFNGLVLLALGRIAHDAVLRARGERLAAESRRRHEIVLDFLLALGVPDGDARRDAEGIEHHVSPTTLARFEAIADSADRPLGSR